MLVEFQAENFMAIKDQVSLDLVAINYYKEKSEQLWSIKVRGLGKDRILRGAAIFGPNASGKSTLFKALRTMQGMISSSSSYTPDKGLPYSPFMLDSVSRNKPTKFLIKFSVEGTLYEYSYSYNLNEILHEELCAYPNERKQVWFKRSGTDVKASTKISFPAALKPLLNNNMLLFSLLAKYPNYKSSGAIFPLFEWICSKLVIISGASRLQSEPPLSESIISGKTGTDFDREFIQNLLRKADVGIVSSRVETNSMPEDLKTFIELTLPAIKQMNPNIDIDEIDDSEVNQLIFKHIGIDNVPLDVTRENESEGTLQVTVLSGYIAQAIEDAKTLIIDELDSSLHTIILIEIINCFLDPKINKKGAQIIFSAHNPCILNDLLRRDQIWFTEKKPDGSVSFYPLSDFKPRNDETILTSYLMGRYSAVPIIPKSFDLDQIL